MSGQMDIWNAQKLLVVSWTGTEEFEIPACKLTFIPFLHQLLIWLAEACFVPSLQMNFPEGYVSLKV